MTASSELLIDGHWWHVERIAVNESAPTWRTSPPSGPPPTYLAAAGSGLRWVAVDLGTKATLARRNDEPVALARPLA